VAASNPAEVGVGAAEGVRGAEWVNLRQRSIKRDQRSCPDRSQGPGLGKELATV